MIHGGRNTSGTPRKERKSEKAKSKSEKAKEKSSS